MYQNVLVDQTQPGHTTAMFSVPQDPLQVG